MPGPLFLEQQYSGGPNQVVSPISQAMTPTQSSQGERDIQQQNQPIQRSPMGSNVSHIQPSIKTNMHPGPGGPSGPGGPGGPGPISPMNVGPGNNFQGGPFPQGGPFGGPQGNVGPGGFGGMNFPMNMQGNMMQPGNMMGNMDPRMMMQGNMQGNFPMNPMHGMQNYPNMMMGPNAGKMPGGGFGGPMGMQGQFGGDQGGRPGQQPQTQQKVMDLRNEIMGMIHKTNVPMGGPNQDMSNF